jgi:hypothetical protein
MAIVGFEIETAKLTKDELAMAEVMIPAFKRHVGKEHAIPGSLIVKTMKEKGYKITDVRLRKIVHYLTETGKTPPIAANSQGYYIPKNEAEEYEHCLSIVQRMASMAVRAKVYSCFGEIMTGFKQLKIFESDYSKTEV